jgi:hypothetical protein
VKVPFLKDILKEIRIRGVARDFTGIFIQLLAAELKDKAKKNLLEESDDLES